MEGVQNSELAASHRGLVFKEVGTSIPAEVWRNSVGLAATGDDLFTYGLLTHMFLAADQKQDWRRDPAEKETV